MAEPVGGVLGVGFLHSFVEAAERQRQVGFLLALRRQDGPQLGIGVSGLEAGQDGLDAHHGVHDIGAGVAFKSGEAVDVENVVLVGLVGQVAVLDGRQTHLVRDVPHLRFGQVAAVALYLFIDGIADAAQQVFQTHDAAVTGLEGLAVLAVHGAEAHKFQAALLFVDEAGLIGAAEHPHEVQLLALVHHVDDAVGIEVRLPLDDGGKVGGLVLGGAVGFQHHAGRHFPSVALLLDVHHQGAVADIGVAVCLHLLHHGGDEVLTVALAHPDVEVHVQLLVVLLQVVDGHVQDVLPQGAIAGTTLLEFVGGLTGFFLISGVLLGDLGGEGVDLFQVGDGEGGFLRVAVGDVGVKIGQVGLAAFQLHDDEADLQAPVPQMGVADDVVTHEPGDALDCLTDDGRAQVAYVQGLCHVGAAVVHHDGQGVLRLLHAAVRVLFQLIEQLAQKVRVQIQVDKAGAHHLCLGEHLIGRQHVHDLLGDHKGGFMIQLCSGHSAIALVLAQVGSIGHGAFAQLGVEAGARKGFGYGGGDLI